MTGRQTRAKTKAAAASASGTGRTPTLGTGAWTTGTGRVRRAPRKSTTPQAAGAVPDDINDQLSDVDNDFASPLAVGKRFRRIRQGHGQVYQKDNDIPYVGTLQLDTCLAVYFAIDATHFFFAHVNFDIRDETGQDIARIANGTERLSYRINPATFTQARRMMKTMLDKARADAKLQGWWGGINDNSISDVMVNSLIMSSPWSDKSGKLYAADALAQAVREWMGIPVAQYGHYPVEKRKRLILKHPIKTDADLTWLEPDGNIGDDGRQLWRQVPEDFPHPDYPDLPFGCAAIRRNGQITEWDENGQVTGATYTIDTDDDDDT